jgi:hypothetical protein
MQAIFNDAVAFLSECRSPTANGTNNPIDGNVQTA